MSTATLHIIIVGAGLGGLATAIALAREGHEVQVFEHHKGLSEYGAGIQVTPNASRILSRLGVQADQVAFAPKVSIARRYKTGEILGEVPQNPESEQIYGYPYWSIFRPDFQRVLAESAVKEGVAIHYGRTVVSIDPNAGSVQFGDGRKETADLVICADGVQSRTRRFITQHDESPVIPLVESNYRATIPAQKMLAHPDTAELLNSSNTQSFLGPGAAIIAYPISEGKLYNLAIVTAAAEGGSGEGSHVGRWDHPVDLDAFRSMFKDFCPLARQLIGLADEVAGWQIGEVAPLPTWHLGRAVLLGDAAHAMSPHASQGSAMALEDGVILAKCLKTVTNLDTELSAALRKYEEIRTPRVERIAEIAKSNGGLWVLPDGAEQVKRDDGFKRATAEQRDLTDEENKARLQQRSAVKGDPDAAWPSIALTTWIYGFDAFSASV